MFLSLPFGGFIQALLSRVGFCCLSGTELKFLILSEDFFFVRFTNASIVVEVDRVALHLLDRLTVSFSFPLHPPHCVSFPATFSWTCLSELFFYTHDS